MEQKTRISCPKAILGCLSAVVVMLLMVCMFAQSALAAESFTVDGVRYTVIAGANTPSVVVGGTGATAKPAIDTEQTGSLVIPAKVSYEDVTYKVTKVGDNAFNRAAIESITIPETVQLFGDNCFVRCPNLTTIIFKCDMYYASWTGEPIVECTAIKDVVFDSVPFWQSYLQLAYPEDPGRDREMGILFDEVNMYCKVLVFASREDALAARKTGEKLADNPNTDRSTLDWPEPTAVAYVKRKTEYKDILRGTTEEVDVYSGALPELDQDQAYRFMAQSWPGREEITGLVNTVTYAYAADRNDFGEAKFSMSRTYTNAMLQDGKITDAKVVLIDGTELELGTEFTLSYKHVASGELVDKIEAPGTYEVTASPAEGTPYTGSLRAYVVHATTGSFCRIAGDNPLDISNAALQKGNAFRGKPSDCLVVATSESWQDAAIACGLAGVKDASLFLIPGKTKSGESGNTWLSAKTRTKIYNTGATEVIIVGDEESVSEDIDDEIASISSVKTVNRFCGEGYAETSFAVYNNILHSSNEEDAWSDTAVIVSDKDYIGAASIAPFATNTKAFVLMASEGVLSDTQLSAVDSAARVIVIGDSTDVNDAVANALKNKGKEVVRIGTSSGINRNREICTWEFEQGMGLQTVAVASSSKTRAVEAYCACSFSSLKNGITILTDGTEADAVSVNEFLDARKNLLYDCFIIGGTDSISGIAATVLNALWTGYVPNLPDGEEQGGNSQTVEPAKPTPSKATTTKTTAAKATAKKVTSVTINKATVSAKAVKAAIGKNAKTVVKVTLGKKVKKISAKAFSKFKNVKTIVVKSTKLKKAKIKNCFKSSKVKTVKVPKSKYKAYKKIFVKKVCGKKVKVKK